MPVGCLEPDFTAVEYSGVNIYIKMPKITRDTKANLASLHYIHVTSGFLGAARTVDAFDLIIKFASSSSSEFFASRHGTIKVRPTIVLSSDELCSNGQCDASATTTITLFLPPSV